MTNRTLMRGGTVGAVIAAICCFTPILTIGLGLVGLSAWVTHLDAVLFPVLGLSMLLALFGWWRLRREAACQPSTPQSQGPDRA